jgi:hypothetical protein
VGKTRFLEISGHIGTDGEHDAKIFPTDSGRLVEHEAVLEVARGIESMQSNS